MAKHRTENIVGWIGSFIFHLLLLILFLLTRLPEFAERVDFVEVNWGGVSSIAAAQLSSSQASLGEAGDLAVPATTKTVAQKNEPTQRVDTPERRLPDPSNEIIRVPRSDKITSSEANLNAKQSKITRSGEREFAGTSTTSRKEIGIPGRTGTAGGAAKPSIGMGSADGSIGSGTSYSIQWLNGGTRQKIAGDLPKYPQGVNVEAQIKVRTTITPDGSVKIVTPAQKANQRMEDAAMKEVRLWRFEPLRSSQRQDDQECIITFLFKLK
ncbi:MAG: energy transducer TonB [bacterium]